MLLTTVSVIGCNTHQADSAGGPSAGLEGPFPDLATVGAEWRSSGVKTCESPTTGPLLTQITDPARWPVGDPATWSREAPWRSAEGIAVADFTGDGVIDVFRPTFGADQLLVGSLDPGGYRLQPAPEGWRGDEIDADSEGATPADVDGDGDLDLLLTRWDHPDVLWLNDGAGRFAASSALTDALGDHLVATLGGSFGDADSDGDLDLLLLATGAGPTGPPPWHDATDFEPAEPNALLVNDGQGGFSEGDLPDFELEPYSCCAAWVDLDGDHDQDAFVVNDFGPQVVPNFVLEQTPDGLRAGGGLGSDLGAGLDIPMYGMGLSVGDLNDDLQPDFVTADWGRVWLSLSDGDGGWYDTTRAAGLEPAHPDSVVAWGPRLLDVDNDGDLDLWQSYGYLGVEEAADETFEQAGLPNPRLQPDALYLQGDDGTFTDQGAAWGLDADTMGRGGVWTDLNRDGVLDLVAQQIDGPPRLHLSRCSAASWVTVALRQDGPNPFAVGARVLVESGDWRGMRWVLAGAHTVSSGGPPEVHLGLGDRDTIDRLTVVWPDATMSVIEDLDVNQHLEIARAE
jgi:hypothetical protein